MGDPDDDFVVEEVQPKTVTLVRTRGVGQRIEVKVLTGRLRDKAVRLVEVKGKPAKSLGEEATGSGSLAHLLQSGQVAQGMDRKLDIGGLADILSPVAIPRVDDRVVERPAVGVEQEDAGGVETESVLIVKLVLTRAQRHDDRVVEEVALQHTTNRF